MVIYTALRAAGVDRWRQPSARSLPQGEVRRLRASTSRSVTAGSERTLAVPLPDAAPGPGEVAIDVTHAAVGLIDVFIRQGLYRDRPGLPPYVPGREVAGTVRALGDGVAGFEAGEPVVTLSADRRTGGYAAI